MIGSGSGSTKILLQKAGRLLARRAYSRGELEAKLSLKADGQEVEAVLRRLEELKLLNDGQYAYNFALNRMEQNGWGPVKVLHSLLRRRIAPSLAESSVDRVKRELGEEFLLKGYMKDYGSRHGLPQDRKAVQRLIGHLKRRGFHEEAIYCTLRQLIPSETWRRFDTGE